METSRQASALRLGSTGLISTLGAVFAGLNGRHLLLGVLPAPEFVLAILGVVLGLVLLVTGGLLYREEFTARQLARIAGWAALGTVLLGFVLALIVLSGVGMEAPAAATLLSVSTFAHVLIGVRDVQRIRATELARKREKLSVLNRLVRHNLRHEAQQLLGAKAALTERLGAESDVVEDLDAVATRLTEMHERLERSQSLLSERIEPAGEIDLADVVRSVLESYETERRGPDFDVTLPETASVRAGAEVETALDELIKNAVAHADSTVRVAVRESGSKISLVVEDDGPGMPDAERAVIMREAEIGDLSHSQGLGLWFVRWVMDTYDGTIDIASSETGTRVALGFQR